MFLREQFLEVCPKDLAVHLKEREIASLEDLANAADRYLTAHQRKFCTVSNAPTSQPTTISDGTNTASIGERALREGKPLSRCYICDKPGHKTVDCRFRGKRRCFRCQKLGHEAKDCWNSVGTSRQESNQKAPYRAVSTKDHRDGRESEDRNPTSRLSSDAGIETSGCLLERPARAKNGFLVLADGTEVPYVSYIEDACSNRAFPMDGEMAVREGKVDDRVVQTLRDTGCSGILVKQELVKPDQYTGKFGFIKLADCTVREVPLAKIKIDTPYLTGDVEALWPRNAIYDLIIGNVPEAKDPNDPRANQWQVSALTRVALKRTDRSNPLVTSIRRKWMDIDRAQLSRLQSEDTSLHRYRDETRTQRKG